MEVLASLGVDASIMRVDPRVEIDLGPDHVQERVRVVTRQSPGLVLVHDVVGQTGDLRREIRTRPQAAKGLHIHRGSSAVEVNMRLR